MLICTRKLGEKIYVGDDVVITVTDIDRGKIRLGIECPKDVPIFRRELLSPERRAEIESNAKGVQQ